MFRVSSAVYSALSFDFELKFLSEEFRASYEALSRNLSEAVDAVENSFPSGTISVGSYTEFFMSGRFHTLPNLEYLIKEGKRFARVKFSVDVSAADEWRVIGTISLSDHKSVRIIKDDNNGIKSVNDFIRISIPLLLAQSAYRTRYQTVTSNRRNSGRIGPLKYNIKSNLHAQRIEDVHCEHVKASGFTFRATWQTAMQERDDSEERWSIERGLYFKRVGKFRIFKFNSELRYNTDFFDESVTQMLQARGFNNRDNSRDKAALAGLFGLSLASLENLSRHIKTVVKTKRAFAVGACEYLQNLGLPLYSRNGIAQNSNQGFLSFDCAYSMMYNKVTLSWNLVPGHTYQLEDYFLLEENGMFSSVVSFSKINIRWTWAVNEEYAKVNIIPEYVSGNRVSFGEGDVHNCKKVEINIHIEKVPLHTASFVIPPEQMLTKADIFQCCALIAKVGIAKMTTLFSGNRLINALPTPDVEVNSPECFEIGQDYLVWEERKLDLKWKGLSSRV